MNKLEKPVDMDRVRWLAEIGGEGSVAAVELRWLLAEYDKLDKAMKEIGGLVVLGATWKPEVTEVDRTVGTMRWLAKDHQRIRDALKGLVKEAFLAASNRTNQIRLDAAIKAAREALE